MKPHVRTVSNFLRFVEMTRLPRSKSLEPSSIISKWNNNKTKRIYATPFPRLLMTEKKKQAQIDSLDFLCQPKAICYFKNDSK